MKKHPKHSRYWAEDLSRRWFQIDRWYRQPKYVWDREHETSIQTIQSLHGVQMVAWPLKAGEDMIVSISVTEAMALSAALRTSCEHPGFTMLFTFVCGPGKNWSANAQYDFRKGQEFNNEVGKIPSPSTPAIVWFFPCSLGLQHTVKSALSQHPILQTEVAQGFGRCLPSRSWKNFVATVWKTKS